MPLDYEIPPPYENIPIDERPLLLDESGNLTIHGERELHHHFRALAKEQPKEAHRRYNQMERSAQKYVRDRGILAGLQL